MATPASVRAAIIDALEQIDASGPPYTTLTVGTVITGRPPLSLPAVGEALVYLWIGTLSYGRDEEAPVGARRVSVEWHLVIYGGPGPDSEDREAWIDGATQDVVDGLDAALQEGGALHDADVLDVGEIEVSPFQGSQPNTSDPYGIWVRMTSLHLDGLL